MSKSYSGRIGPRVSKHAFLSPSNPAWLNYTPDRLIERFNNHQAAALGTKLHNIAAELIDHRIFVAADGSAFSEYVNDCIRYEMATEVTLVYSDYAFGTADSIRLLERPPKPLLRINDLKTGATPGKVEQTEIYAALYCLQEGLDPRSMDYELRIYHADGVVMYNPDGDRIWWVCNRIIELDDILRRYEVGG